MFKITIIEQGSGEVKLDGVFPGWLVVTLDKDGNLRPQAMLPPPGPALAALISDLIKMQFVFGPGLAEPNGAAEPKPKIQIARNMPTQRRVKLGPVRPGH